MPDNDEPAPIRQGVNHNPGIDANWLGKYQQDWLGECQLKKDATPLNNLHNILLALRGDLYWAYQLRFDEMAQCIVTPEEPLTDKFVRSAHEWLQANGLRSASLALTEEAIEIVARERPFHPLKQKLKTLMWDQELRKSTWLHRYLGAPDNDYTRSVGAWFLISMVARVFQPGCQADYMLVLEGEQGELKSQICRTLGEPYFSNHLPDLSDDAIRVSMHLRGKWLIEIAELHSFERSGPALLKSFISRQVEQFTPKFGRYEVQEKRQCVFIGTTNETTYLRDETGGRRFWPVKCGNIDLEGLRRDRDQLFAEALEAYENGANWWPDRNFEKLIIEPEQEARLYVDGWVEPIREFLFTKNRVTVMEVARGALRVTDDHRVTPGDLHRITRTMRALGWRDFHNKKERWWAPTSGNGSGHG
jgi:predicted P-loop ATPase